jgi:8-oxo-dGTP diphosphatase
VETDFVGTKTALFAGDKLVVFLRDNKKGLRFANMWDFPGGGREVEETPFECLRREVNEEFGITLNEKDIIWEKKYPAMHDPALTAYFMVARIPKERLATVSFGSEGQKWTLMTPEEFLARDDAVPHLLRVGSKIIWLL